VAADPGDRRAEPVGRGAPDLVLDRAHQPLHARVVGGQEARLLVREVLVEGLARHAGAVDDVGDRGVAVALLGDGDGDRLEHALALRAPDDLARRGVASARQDARRGRGRVGVRRAHLAIRIISET
jgi:hypothetical protein